MFVPPAMAKQGDAAVALATSTASKIADNVTADMGALGASSDALAANILEARVTTDMTALGARSAALADDISSTKARILEAEVTASMTALGESSAALAGDISSTKTDVSDIMDRMFRQLAPDVETARIGARAVSDAVQAEMQAMGVGANGLAGDIAGVRAPAPSARPIDEIMAELLANMDRDAAAARTNVRAVTDEITT